MKTISKADVLRIINADCPNTNPDYYNLKSKNGYGQWMHENGRACMQAYILCEIDKLPVHDVDKQET